MPARGFMPSVLERSGHLSVGFEEELERQNLNTVAHDWNVARDICNVGIHSFNAGSKFPDWKSVKERNLLGFDFLVTGIRVLILEQSRERQRFSVKSSTHSHLPPQVYLDPSLRCSAAFAPTLYAY